MKRLFVFISLVMCALAHAQQPQLEAHEAWVDLETNELVIKGVNFDNGNVLEVTLGDVLLSVVPSADPALAATEIRAAMPALLSPGTYTVRITSGGGSIRYDEIDITVGNTGPRGQDGPPGPKGDPGATGAKGDTGEQGPPGQDGDDCTVTQLGTPDSPLGVTVTCGATTATIPKGDKGEKGEPGVDGAPGADGVNGLPGPAGLACWDLNGDGLKNIADEDFNGDGVVDVNDCKGDQVINLTVEIPDVLGLVAQDFVTIFPDSVNNLASLEVEGILNCRFEQVVVVNGPASETQIFESFDALGRPVNHSGLTTALPIVLEFYEDSSSTGGACIDKVREWIANPTSNEFVDRALTLISLNIDGSEAVRWNLFGFAPMEAVAGLDGRTRVRFENSLAPSNRLSVQRESPFFGFESSNNTVTDKRVEWTLGYQNYPALEPSSDPDRLILVFDANEAALHYEHYRQVVEKGTVDTFFQFPTFICSGVCAAQGEMKLTLSVIEESSPGVEVSRRNYFGCIPVRWEQFQGFTQFITLKERVIYQCDFSEQA